MDGIRIVRLCATAAWADGQLEDKEADALRRLIDGTGDLSGAERDEALGYLAEPPLRAESEVATLPRATREDLYRAARKMVAIDRDLDDREVAFLDRLRLALGIDRVTRERIENE